MVRPDRHQVEIVRCGRNTSVTFLPSNVTVEAAPGATLLDAALDYGIWLEHECGGNCSCTTCLIRVIQGAEHLSPVEEPEEYRLSTSENRSRESRLACQALLLGGPVSVLLQAADSPRAGVE